MNLQKLLNPESVAVVGVSDKPGFGYNAADGVLGSSIAQHAYFVHPRRETFKGRKCYRSLSELPEIVDCVILCTPCHTIPSLLEEAGQSGIQAAIIYASGFSEEGTQTGILLEQQVKSIALKYDLAVLGPNCMGIMNNVENINMWGGNVKSPGKISTGIGLVAQSGFVCSELLSAGYLSVSYAISSGNGNICNLEDFLSFLADDANVSVIAIYLEGIKAPGLFLDTLRRAARSQKPVVVLKTGRTRRGAQAAASHTGSMAGASEVFAGIFKKYGVLVADTLEEFICMAQALCVLRGNYPRGTRYGMISLSGGESTLSADLAEELGVNLAELSPKSKENIQKYIPSFASAKNPLDATTALFGDEARTVALLKTFADDPQVDAITVGANVKFSMNPTMKALCSAMATAVQKGIVTKPIFAVPSLENYRHPETRQVLEAAGVPLMSSMGTAFQCLKKIAEFSNYRYEDRNLTVCIPKDHHKDTAAAMSESDSKQELMNCGIPVPAQAIVRSEEELKEAFRKMQLPIALKINSSEILHKTEAGGVKLNVTSVEDALLAVRQIRENVKEAMPQASTDGILLQEMAPAGVEIIIGIINDPQFGPMLLTGLGGIFVELLKDTVLYPAPINKTEAEMILKSLKTSRLLTGYRGSAPCDLEALEDLMVKISEYAALHKDTLKEMDLNPVFVYPQGQGVCAVDALIVKYPGK
ncbi:probable acetyl-CoA synthetase [Blautia hydrogenotrophica CAG:147]|uniref:acetate--CoA ligase family protein n=1 Tax=Blautia hydrogenotrophica TaxID=53443 RepID=UPI00033DC3AF|nr:acetate--CoA ligase family protein [Blautia hydrogenotrophica]CCX59489.1 probable acetyl-CoA synthetase [Blautia hydrogenotrophica CAG:147]CUM93321.1 Uncharacterized conserved protein [Blautia hydrogenotrophica]SCH48647.1 Uncharacterized conserved protein [uncultured Blautia sp.]